MWGMIVDRIGLTDIFVRKLVTESYALRLVLHGLAVNDSLTELLYDRFVDGVALSRILGNA